MPDGTVLAALAIAAMVYLGSLQLVKGVKWIGHRVGHAVTFVLHPKGGAK
jgi:hypothetical protein